MDMFISINDVDIPNGNASIRHYDNPYMPRTVSNPYYVVEFHESDEKILSRINDILPMIEKQFCKDEDYLLEKTSGGFKLKKKIISGTYSKDSWDSWNHFSSILYKEIAKAVGLHSVS